MELSKGRYCAYLDADDYWEQGFIEKTVAFLNKHLDCVAVNVAQCHLTVSGSSIVPICYAQYKSHLYWMTFSRFGRTICMFVRVV